MEDVHYLQRSNLYRKLIYGPHGKFARVFADRLLDDQLSRQCTLRSLSLFRDLMDWHIGSGNGAADLSEEHVARFLEHRCQYWHTNMWDRATLRRLLSALRDQGMVPPALPIELTPQQKVMEAFSAHLAKRTERDTPQPQQRPVCRYAMFKRRGLRRQCRCLGCLALGPALSMASVLR